MRQIALRFPVLLFLLGAAWSAAAPPALTGQSVAVRLETAGQEEGPVAEEFRSALGALDDTELVGSGELAEYVVVVSTLCVPEADRCRAADAYAVSVVLTQPLSGAALGSGLARTGDRTLADWDASPEAESFFQRYRQMHALWTTRWGADRVPERVSRLVRGIDARCFEKRRTLERQARLRARDDTARTESYVHELDVEGNWLC